MSFLALLAAWAAASIDDACPCFSSCEWSPSYDSSAVNGRCFREYTVSLRTWEAAQLECLRDGGRLVESQVYLSGYTGRTDIWTGAKVRGDAMVWNQTGAIVDGSFQSVEGGHHGDGNCGLFQHPYIYRYYCHDRIAFVCEKPRVRIATRSAVVTYAAAAGADFGAQVPSYIDVDGDGPLEHAMFVWGHEGECISHVLTDMSQLRDGKIAVPWSRRRRSAEEGTHAHLVLCWFGPVPNSQAELTTLSNSYGAVVPTAPSRVAVRVLTPPALVPHQAIAMSAALLPVEVSLLGTNLESDALIGLFATPDCDGEALWSADSRSTVLPASLPEGISYFCAAAWATGATPSDTARPLFQPSVNVTLNVHRSPIFDEARTYLPHAMSLTGGHVRVSGQHIELMRVAVRWNLREGCDPATTVGSSHEFVDFNSSGEAEATVPAGVPTGRPLHLCYALNADGAEEMWHATSVVTQIMPPPYLPAMPSPDVLNFSYTTASAGVDVTIAGRNLYTPNAARSMLYLVRGSDEECTGGIMLRGEEEIRGTSVTGSATVSADIEGSGWLCIAVALHARGDILAVYPTHVQMFVRAAPVFAAETHVVSESEGVALPLPSGQYAGDIDALVFGLSRAGCDGADIVSRAGQLPAVEYPTRASESWYLCWSVLGATPVLWHRTGVEYVLVPSPEMTGARPAQVTTPYNASANATVVLEGTYLTTAVVYWVPAAGDNIADPCDLANGTAVAASASVACSPYCEELPVAVPAGLGDAASSTRYFVCVDVAPSDEGAAGKPAGDVLIDAGIFVDVVLAPSVAPQTVDVTLQELYGQGSRDACRDVWDVVPPASPAAQEGHCLSGARLVGRIDWSVIYIAAVDGDAGVDSALCDAPPQSQHVAGGGYVALPSLRPGRMVSLCYALGYEAPSTAWGYLNVTVTAAAMPTFSAATYRPTPQQTWGGTSPFAMRVFDVGSAAAHVPPGVLYYALCNVDANGPRVCSPWESSATGTIRVPHVYVAAHSPGTHMVSYALSDVDTVPTAEVLSTGVRVELPSLMPFAADTPDRLLFSYGEALVGLKLPVAPVAAAGLWVGLQHGGGDVSWGALGADGVLAPVPDIGTGEVHRVVVTWDGATERPLATGTGVLWYGPPVFDAFDVDVTLLEYLVYGRILNFTGTYTDRGIVVHVGCDTSDAPPLPLSESGSAYLPPLPSTAPREAANYTLCWAPLVVVNASSAQPDAAPDRSLGGVLPRARLGLPAVPSFAQTTMVVPRTVHMFLVRYGIDGNARIPPLPGGGLAYSMEGQYFPRSSENPVDIVFGCAQGPHAARARLTIDTAATASSSRGSVLLPYTAVAATGNGSKLCWSAGDGHLAPFAEESAVVLQGAPNVGPPRVVAVQPSHLGASSGVGGAALFPPTGRGEGEGRLDGVYALWVDADGNCTTGRGARHTTPRRAEGFTFHPADMPPGDVNGVGLRVCYAVIHTWIDGTGGVQRATAADGSSTWLTLPEGTAGVVLDGPFTHPTFSVVLAGFPSVSGVGGFGVVDGTVVVPMGAGARDLILEGHNLAGARFRLADGACDGTGGLFIDFFGSTLSGAALESVGAGRWVLCVASTPAPGATGVPVYRELVQVVFTAGTSMPTPVPAAVTSAPATTTPQTQMQTSAPPTPVTSHPSIETPHPVATAHPLAPPTSQPTAVPRPTSTPLPSSPPATVATPQPTSPPQTTAPLPAPVVPGTTAPRGTSQPTDAPTEAPETSAPATRSPPTAVPATLTTAAPCPPVSTLGVLARLNCYGSLSEAGRLVGCLRTGGTSTACLAQYERCVSDVVGHCPPYNVTYTSVTSPITVVFGMDTADFDAGLFAAALASYVEVVPWLIEVTTVDAGSVAVGFQLRGPNGDDRAHFLTAKLAAGANPWAPYAWALVNTTDATRAPRVASEGGSSKAEVALLIVTACGMVFFIGLLVALWMNTRRLDSLKADLAILEGTSLADDAESGSNTGSAGAPAATPARSPGARSPWRSSPASALRCAKQSLQRFVQRVTSTPPSLTDLVDFPPPGTTEESAAATSCPLGPPAAADPHDQQPPGPFPLGPQASTDGATHASRQRYIYPVAP